MRRFLEHSWGGRWRWQSDVTAKSPRNQWKGEWTWKWKSRFRISHLALALAFGIWLLHLAFAFALALALASLWYWDVVVKGYWLGLVSRHGNSWYCNIGCVTEGYDDMGCCRVVWQVEVGKGTPGLKYFNSDER